jgi:hypothetical protein
MSFLVSYKALPAYSIIKMSEDFPHFGTLQSLFSNALLVASARCSVTEWASSPGFSIYQLIDASLEHRLSIRAFHPCS